VSFRHKFGEGMSTKLDSSMVQRITAWIGVFGFMIGAQNSCYSACPISLNHELSIARPRVFPYRPHVVRKSH
jgi:hypothetical protein